MLETSTASGYSSTVETFNFSALVSTTLTQLLAMIVLCSLVPRPLPTFRGRGLGTRLSSMQLVAEITVLIPKFSVL